MKITLVKYLVTTRRLSNKEAIRAILGREVFLNEKIADTGEVVSEFDTIYWKGECLQKGKEKIYLGYYKPRGIESTLNLSVKNNIREALPSAQKLFPLGRLDKESEGLMILTNDGEIYNRVTHRNSQKEKEYLVKVDKPLNNEMLYKLSSGLVIMGKTTDPCSVVSVEYNTFRIILKQGMNRQIRRMCYKLGYGVLELKRIRIGQVLLESLLPGETRKLTDNEINLLYNFQ